MGIYNLPLLPKTICSPGKNEIGNVALDGENMVGICLNSLNGKLNYEEECRFITKEIYSCYKYLRDKGVKCFLVFRGEEKKHTKREKLKQKQGILKAFTNISKPKITKKIQRYIWKKLTDFIRNNRVPKYHELYGFYEILYSNKEKKEKSKEIYKYLKNNNRKLLLQKLSTYVWNKPNEYKEMFEKFIINQEIISSKEFIETSSEEFLTEISNWNYENMSEKKLDKYLEYVKNNITKYSKCLNIIYTPYDPDDFIITMKREGLINTVVSQDSDFIASGLNMITDIDFKNNFISFLKKDNFYDDMKKKGYSKKSVDIALAISSADYNYKFYMHKIKFKSSLNYAKYYKSFDILYYEYCKYYNKIYKKDESEIFEKVYDLKSIDISRHEIYKTLTYSVKL